MRTGTSRSWRTPLTVTVSVLRQDALTGVWKEISHSNPITPQDDPKTDGFDGFVEVNHPGGGCWQIVTPDLRPGDVVRYTNAAGILDRIPVLGKPFKLGELAAAIRSALPETRGGGSADGRVVSLRRPEGRS